MFDNRYSVRFLAISLILTCITFACVRYAIIANPTRHGVFLRTASSILAFLSLANGLIFAHLATLPVSRLHTMRTAIAHYFMNIALYVISGLLSRQWKRCTRNVRESQERVLNALLTQNARTELGEKLRFSGIKSYEDYKTKVPLSNYDDYRPYIERIENGEQNLLSTDKVVHLNISSGTTTGKCKLLPCGKQVINNFIAGLILPLIYRQKSKYSSKVSPFAPLKSLDLLYVPKLRYAPCGLPIGPLSGAIGKESLFTTLPRTTPLGCQAFMKEPAQMYLHWLYALFDDEVCAFNGSFAGSAIVGFEFLRNNWKQLTNDIRSGTLTNTFEIPDEVARFVKLPPNPQRAAKLEAQFEQGFQGIVKRLWPRINASWCISTGAHAVYVDRLKWFLGNEIQILSPIYASSEAVFGAPMSSKQDREMNYTLMVGVNFMEFIPESEICLKNPTTLLMHQLEIGKRYEIVPTSAVGFYRYRVGDIIRVVDFYHQTPVVEFCTRIGGILDLHGEKTSEDMVFSALRQSVSQWKGATRLDDFASSEGESLSKAIPHEHQSFLYYVLFVEINGLNRALRSEEICIFDEALMEASYPYKSFRVKDGIGLPKVFVVKPGTFEALKRFILERNGAVSNQYKTPRYQANPELLRFLYERSFSSA